MIMQSEKSVVLHSLAPTELEELITKVLQKELEHLNEQLQMVMGDDDLISSGTACRLLGVSSKILKVLLDEGYFTVFYHLRERRFRRSEILEYRNKYAVAKRRDK